MQRETPRSKFELINARQRCPVALPLPSSARRKQASQPALPTPSFLSAQLFPGADPLNLRLEQKISTRSALKSVYSLPVRLFDMLV
jgi:hypothetical protein